MQKLRLMREEREEQAKKSVENINRLLQDRHKR